MMREAFKDKKRIVFKVGSSTITHEETGGLDLVKLEKFVRILTDLHNQGKDIIVVSSGAIASATRRPSIAADMIPPAYPAPSPHG